MSELVSEQKDLAERHYSITNPLAKQIDDLAEKERYHLPSQERLVLKARLDELNHSFQVKFDAITRKIDILHNQNSLGEMIARMEDRGFIRGTKAKAPRVTRARVVLEFIFPAGYAIAAIVFAIENW